MSALQGLIGPDPSENASVNPMIFRPASDISERPVYSGRAPARARSMVSVGVGVPLARARTPLPPFPKPP